MLSAKVLARRVTAEFTGTAFLVAAVVGSGIMAERLAGGNAAIALLANTIATGAALVTLILAFAPISGAHFNPAVSFAAALEGQLRVLQVGAYIAAQIVGGVAGTLAAHMMFSLPLISLSRHARAGSAQAFSEFIATFGLLAVIWGTSARANLVPYRRWSLYHRGVLVHGVHLVRQSRRYPRAIAEQHVFWHSSCRCTLLHWLAIPGRHRRGPALSLAGSADGRACLARNSRRSRGRT